MKAPSLTGILTVASISFLHAGNIEINFEDSAEGLRASYQGSLDLTGLTEIQPDRYISYIDFSSEFSSEIVLADTFAFAFSNLPSEQDLVFYEAENGSRVVNFVFQAPSFSSENATQASGDVFGFSIAGTAVPGFRIVVASDYVSGTQLSGTLVFPDLNLENVQGLHGIHAIDNQANNTFTVLIDSTPPPHKLTQFTFDPATGNATIDFFGAAAQLYNIRCSNSLDFSEAKALILDNAQFELGRLSINRRAFFVNEEGRAKIVFPVNEDNAAFFRIEAIINTFPLNL